MPRQFELSELPFWRDDVRAGEKLLLRGTVYTARDAAHAELAKLLREGSELPIPLDGAVLYYAGPSETPPGKVIGACGPTTSSRMDPYTLPLLERGLAAAIGKGERAPEIRDAFFRLKRLYFCAVGGAGALAAKHITACETVAFPQLGCEAVRRLVLTDFPVYCAYDAQGGDIFVKSN